MDPPHAMLKGRNRNAVAKDELITQTNAVAQRSSSGIIQRQPEITSNLLSFLCHFTSRAIQSEHGTISASANTITLSSSLKVPSAAKRLCTFCPRLAAIPATTISRRGPPSKLCRAAYAGSLLLSTAKTTRSERYDCRLIPRHKSARCGGTPCTGMINTVGSPDSGKNESRPLCVQ